MKVFNGYAFSENEMEKSEINHQNFHDLCEKWVVAFADERTSELMRVIPHEKDYGYKLVSEDNDALVDLILMRHPGYKHSEYEILGNVTGLSLVELLLIADKGNLCFGGSRLSNGRLYVFED